MSSIGSTWDLSKAILRSGLSGVDACSSNAKYVADLIGAYKPIVDAMIADKSLHPGKNAWEDWNVAYDDLPSTGHGPSSEVYAKNYEGTDTPIGDGQEIGGDLDMVLLPIQQVWAQLLSTHETLSPSVASNVAINNSSTTVGIIIAISSILLVGATLVGTLVLSAGDFIYSLPRFIAIKGF
jgi:hypothetical protein